MKLEYITSMEVAYVKRHASILIVVRRYFLQLDTVFESQMSLERWGISIEYKFMLHFEKKT